MDQVAAGEAVVLLFFLYAVMGTWDGLIRRHIRLSVMQIYLRGPLAMGVGALSLLLAIELARLGAYYVRSVATACRGDIPCIAGNVLLPAFTAWQSAVVVLMAVILFAMWASGARDLGGPYWRHMFAPGVWDRDKEILALVASQLRAHALPPVDDDTVIQMAGWVRRILKYFPRTARYTIMRDGHLDAEALTNAMLRSRYTKRRAKRFALSEQTLPVVLGTIASYFEEKYEQAARVWPWRRKIIPY